MELLIHATQTVFIYKMRFCTPKHTRSIENYFRFNENDKREPTIVDEIRTSAPANVNWY